jgi:radical SAM-linked protein
METENYKLRIFYAKKDFSKFISHRNFGKIIERTMRRLNMPFKFTEGYSPHPRISFGPPLPLFIEGENEFFNVTLIKKIDISVFLKNVNKLLPEGTSFLSAKWIDKKTHLADDKLVAVYTIETKEKNSFVKGEPFGDIIEKGNSLKIRIKLKNFSHKKLKKTFEVSNIKRKILC